MDVGEPAPRASRRRRRVVTALAGAAAVIAASLLLAPEGRLACQEPWLSERSPDGNWTLAVCRRPMFFAMPGSSSDAPGWIVLRDAAGAIRGVVHLDMMQLLAESGPAGGLRWTQDEAILSGLATLPLAPASGPASRWLEDRLWRLRALFGLVRSDEMSAQ